MRIKLLLDITSKERAKSKEQRAKNKEQRAKSKEQRAKSNIKKNLFLLII